MNAITKGGYQDVPMTRRRAQLLEEYASKLADMLEAAPNDKDLAEWVQSKIDRAAAAIQSAYHYLDQDDESDLEKAVGHKYTHRKPIGRDPKTNRARYRYYYAEHQGGGISRAKFEAGSAFKLTWKGRRGHFHIDRVEGDQIFITHDSRPNMEPVPVQADELRALLRKQHSKAEKKHVEKRRRQVEEIKRRAHRGGLGLALHRLRQAAAQAGVSLPEQYQRKPKKTRAKVAETAREDRFETMPELESLANKKTTRERSLALRGYKPEELIEIAAHAAIQDKAVNKEVDAKARELEREYKDLANTAARLGSEEELAKEGGHYRYQDAEQAAREKHEERLNLARVDIYNKVYRDILSHLRDQKAGYVERRSAIESRIKELTPSTDSIETTPATTPTNGTAQRQSVLDAAEEAQRLDAQGGSKRSAAAIAADERLAETIRNLISNEYQGVKDVTRSDKPRRQWTVKERELNSLIDRLETLQSAKKKTRSMTAATAQNIRETTRGRLIDEMRRRIETDSKIRPTTPRDQLTSTAQQIIEDANQEHAERHDEHQEITRFELGEHTHTRTGQKLFTAKQTERVDRDEYFRRVEIAKKHNGRYERRYVRGFVFKNAEDARAFALEVEGAAPPETSAETVTPHEEHPGADNFETMPEVEAPAREQLAETVRNITAPSSPLDIDQANAQDTLTENRTRAPESKAADKALIESARELAKTSERGEEIKSALVDLMNAQQLKRYKRATGDTRARAEDMIEKRREARERLRAATSGEVINNFETMPEVETQPKKRSVKQEAREAQEARLIQQKTFDNETQGKITEVYSVLKDRVRLNKKGEVYAIKKPSTLYYGETPTGALAGAVSSATGLSRSAAYNIVNEAVGERRTLAEIQDLLGAQIVEEKKELIRKRPAAIRMLIRNLHTNTREKIRTYTAQFNPAMRHDQRSGIGLESIDLALDKREIARNVSIYGTQDSVLTEEERRKVTYTTMMSAVSVVDRIAARYGNIAELRADAEGVKQTLETFARAALESIKESAERDLRYVKGKIDAGIKDIKETDFKRDMLEARLARAERETSFLDEPEATREEIREIREGLDEAEQILREDTERTAQWYSAEAQRRLAENSVKTMGELTAAIKSGTARRYIEAAVEGSAKEKLAARMFNEIMERLLVETKDQPIEQPPLDTPEPVEKPEGRVSAIASVIDRQAEERAERRQRRLKDKQRALRKTPIHKSITEALVNSLVVESDHAGTQGPTIKKLTDSKQSAVKNILLKTIADTVGTETRGKARELLMKQALGLGGATTGESRRFDSMLVKIQEALTPQMTLARARREVEEIVKRTMVHNLSTSIEKVLKRYVAPQATTSTKRPMSLPHYRDLPVPETPLRDYRMTALYGAAYDRLARKYLSGRELEADAAKIKAKTKQAFRQRLDAQRSRNRDKYNEAFLEATNPNRDTADQRVQVLDHVQAMISTLGLESERGQAGVSLRDQVEQIKRTAERNRAGYQAETDANAQKQAEDLRYLKEEIKPKIMGDQAPAAEAQLLQDYLNDIEDSHNRTGFETKRGRRFAEIQREALQELINELQSTPPKRISEFGEDLDARQSADIRATTPARQALTETAERVTSDQTAEQATTRATPRPSEATLRGSGELDETVRANLQDRAQFLTSGSEDTTKTGRRSKAQKARDGELLLIHRRLQSDAQERLGPTAPRFADYSQLVGMPRADQPENAETRAQFRAALKDAIRELEQATSGRTESVQGLDAYRALEGTFIGHLEEHLKTVSDQDLRAMRGAIDAEVARVEKLTKDEKKRRDDTSAALDKIAEERAAVTRKIEALKPRRDKALDRKESRLNRAYGDQWSEARRARIAYIEKRRENKDPLVDKLSKPLKREENRRARRVQKSARPLITYRAQLIQTVERLTA